MIVSWKWLQDYIALSMSPEELTDRLTLSGLNLEGEEQIAGDLAIDLEVTSNRPDCLGHIGVAREISVLFGSELKIPGASPNETGPAAGDLTSVTIECPELCPRYTARVIRGIQVGPSPEWLADRLRTLGIALINNVVDVSNFVMMESAQPLHAFDFAKLAGGRIIVREARSGEEFTAIDHREYQLSVGTCVIADAENAVALGGVMGGAESEVSDATTDLLIESADFDPLSIRTTARHLNLHSPSSFRFERGVDPVGIDWASRRCCELILKTAGGELAEGVVDVGAQPPVREPIKLRFSQLERILGITVPPDEVRKILVTLGHEETHACSKCLKVVPPPWRADLSREIDLVEEVIRIHGYDKIPEDVGVPLTASSRSTQDLVFEKVRNVMVAAGYYEALTISSVEEGWIDAFRPWTNAKPLRASTPVLRRADCLRQSLVPSLLTSRRTNESLTNPRVELFEIAKVYLPRENELPDERWMLSLSSSGDYAVVKGVMEAIASAVAPSAAIDVVRTEQGLFESGPCGEMRLNDGRFGFLGQVCRTALDRFGLRNPTTVAEIDLGPLVAAAELVHKVKPLSNYPPVDRDLNVVFDEKVHWSDVERIVRDESADLLESLDFGEEYRDPERLGTAKKSLLFSLRLRSPDGTLTNEEADGVRDRVVRQLSAKLGGTLRA